MVTPIHDWTRVERAIFHAFHHRWISAIGDRLNSGLLANDYYALPEQVAAGFGPDVLTLQSRSGPHELNQGGGVAAGALHARPQTRDMAESEGEFYRRKKSSIVVRHASGDRIAAIVEIVSPGNKASGHAFAAFVDKACELLEHRIHLLIIDPFPPGPRDPGGVHAAIWRNVAEDPREPPQEKPLTCVAYECDLTPRASIEVMGVGDPLPAMPLFLEPHGCVEVPLEAT